MDGAEGLDPTADRGDPGLHAALTSIPSDPALEPLFQAIAERRTVTFAYRGGSGGADPAARTVEPWRLDFHRGRWYLTGWDRSREGERNFRLDRIDGRVEQTGEAATVAPSRSSAEGPRPAWEIGAEEPVAARLLVDQDRVEGAARQLGPNVTAEPGPDGSVIFTVPVVRYDAFRSFVLGLLDHAELLEPVGWRDDLTSWLQTLAGAPRPSPAGDVR